MPQDDVQLRKYEFKKALQEIEGLKGNGTELISLYVPPNKQIYDVVQYLREEYSTSSNIKSKSTRKNVLAAIESIMSRLRVFKAPPPTGLVFFVGHVATRGDLTDMYTKIIEPPEAFTTFLYRCDSVFHTEILKGQLEAKELYGLIVIDRKEATIGLLNGTNIVLIANEQSLVPSKHHQGGQSSRRYERLIEIAAHEYFKKIGNIINESFMPRIREMKAVFLGGPGATKEFFLEKDYLRNEIKEKVETPFDIGYTDETGLRELVEKASDTMKDLEIAREKDLLNKFLTEVRKGDQGLAAYGEDSIYKALEDKKVSLLLVSEGLNRKVFSYKCPRCGKSGYFKEKPNQAYCPACSMQLSPNDVKEEDIVEVFYRIADAGNAKVEFISEESEEGKLLKKAFGGMAALLRYASEAPSY